MHHFYRKNNDLFVEKLRVEDLAKKYGTPLYLYSEQTIIDHLDRFRAAFASIDHHICYALKANSNLSILKLFAQRGCGFDLVSGGELFRVQQAGGKTEKSVFAGVGKTGEEIEQALRLGIYYFNVESEAELELINQVAGKMKKKAPVSVRVNPSVDAKTHAKITTGTYANKFGIAYEEIPALYNHIARLPHLRPIGVQMHIGSQITQVKPFVLAVKKMIPLVEHLKKKHGISVFDIGGGMGIVYDPTLESGNSKWWKKKSHPLTIDAYASALLPLLKNLGIKIVMEPGRLMVGNAGILVTEVLYIKKTGKKTFVIVDAGMNDLIRPTLYEAYHQIIPLREKKSRRLVSSDVVGPVCESSDYFAQDRPLPVLQSDDKIAILSAGAYGFSMASNYMTRPRPAEVMVHGNRARVIRQRETLEDLIRGENI